MHMSTAAMMMASPRCEEGARSVDALAASGPLTPYHDNWRHPQPRAPLSHLFDSPPTHPGGETESGAVQDSVAGTLSKALTMHPCAHRALKRVRAATSGRLGYVVPGLLGEEEVDLAVALGLPLLAPAPHATRCAQLCCAHCGPRVWLTHLLQQSGSHASRRTRPPEPHWQPAMAEPSCRSLCHKSAARALFRAAGVNAPPGMVLLPRAKVPPPPPRCAKAPTARLRRVRAAACALTQGSPTSSLAQDHRCPAAASLTGGRKRQQAGSAPAPPTAPPSRLLCAPRPSCRMGPNGSHPLTEHTSFAFTETGDLLVDEVRAHATRVQARVHAATPQAASRSPRSGAVQASGPPGALRGWRSGPPLTRVRACALNPMPCMQKPPPPGPPTQTQYEMDEARVLQLVRGGLAARMRARPKP